jgi:hypothetical protein
MKNFITAVVVFVSCANAFSQEAPLSPPRVVVGGNVMGAEASFGTVLPEANSFRDFLRRLNAAVETRDMVALQALYQTNGSSAQQLNDELGRWRPMFEEDAKHRVSIQINRCIFRDFSRSNKLWKKLAERLTTHKATHLLELMASTGFWMLPLVEVESRMLIVPSDKSQDMSLRWEDDQDRGAQDTNRASSAAGARR